MVIALNPGAVRRCSIRFGAARIIGNAPSPKTKWRIHRYWRVNGPRPKFSIFLSKINEIDIFSIVDAALDLFSSDAREQQDLARTQN